MIQRHNQRVEVGFVVVQNCNQCVEIGSVVVQNCNQCVEIGSVVVQNYNQCVEIGFVEVQKGNYCCENEVNGKEQEQELDGIKYIINYIFVLKINQETLRLIRKILDRI